MKVYLIMEYDYPYTSLIDIFVSREAAQTYKDAKVNRLFSSDWKIEEWEVRDE